MSENIGQLHCIFQDQWTANFFVRGRLTLNNNKAFDEGINARIEIKYLLWWNNSQIQC